MANPFEDFIQVEMPKRPYLATDIAQESILIRRGVGPRQLAGLQLTDGQLLGMKDGQLQGVVPEAVGTPVDGLTHIQSAAETSWVITHNRNNVNVFVQVYDANGKKFDPDDLTVAPNSVTVSLLQAISGHAVLIFLPPETVATPEPEPAPE